VDAAYFGGIAALRHDPLTPTVFHEDWWLNAATGGNYQEVTVSSGGRIVGRLPFAMFHMPAGCALCGMPELTHFLGPAIDAGPGAPANRALKHDKILRDLLAQLPRHSGFYQKLHKDIGDTLAFQDAGYRTTVQFTYEIAPAPAATIWAAMRDKARNVIRRAKEQYTVIELSEPTVFAALYQHNLDARGMANYYHRISEVCGAAIAHNAGRILAARDATGEIVAAIFYVWDTRAAYYLLTTRSSAAANNAVSLLIWNAIQDSAARNLVFDFDGVGTAGSRVFYTGFGGQVSPRYIVSRYDFIHRVAGRLINPFRKKTRDLFQ
jgi:hypothetical protein